MTYTAGSVIEDEYEINLSDGLGNTYRFVAISINDTIIGFTWEGTPPPQGTTLSYTSGNTFDTQSMVPCFASGTVIDTPAGGCPVERLRPGDRVRTADHGAQPILWTGCRTVDRTSLAASPNLLPIRFEPSALGDGHPSRPLTVSPQHRILVRSKIAERLVGDREVLVAAKHLCGLPGITVDMTLAPVTYVHILLERHEVIFANCAGTESMLRAPMALGALSHCNRRKIETLFPARRFPKPMSPARLLVNGRIGRALAARHKRHARPLVLPDFALAD